MSNEIKPKNRQRAAHKYFLINVVPPWYNHIFKLENETRVKAYCGKVAKKTREIRLLDEPGGDVCKRCLEGLARCYEAKNRERYEQRD